MPKTKISEFSATPANNTDIDSINIAEGCAPSGINDAIRELMAQLKDWQSGTSNDPYVVGSSGSLTLNQGTANGVAYLNGSKVVTSGSALTFDGTSFVVGGSTFPDGRIRLKQASDASKQKGLLIEAFADDSLLAIGYDGSAFTFNPTYNTTGAYKPMAWWVSGSEQMRLTSTGLGIGTSSPAEKLHVNSGTGNVPALFESTDPIAVVQFKDNNSTLFNAVGVQTNSLIFYSGDNINMRLDNSGNLGLGVTPTNNTLGKTLQNGQAGAWTAESGTNRWWLGSNWYYNSGDKYINNGFATLYSQQNGTHTFFTAASGTAGNAITFTQAMTLDASGYLLLGATSSAGGGDKRLQVGSTSSSTTQILAQSATTSLSLYASSAAEFYAAYATGSAFILGNGPADASAFTERCRIDSSGNFLLGATAVTASAKFLIQGSSATYNFIVIKDTATSFADNHYQEFANNTGATAGRISHTASTTVAYTTSSDYRLKNTIAPITGALAKVALLKPVTYKWNADGSDGEGFIAHELAEVVPQAVTGEKDAVDEEGNPKYQGIDTSFLVATLTAAIQELKAEFDAYKASHP